MKNRKKGSQPTVIFCGFVGKAPVAGMALANLHVIDGFQSLGYNVHYVERLNHPLECYDPSSNSMTDDPAYAVNYLYGLLPQYGIRPDCYSFIDRDNNCHGSGWSALEKAIRKAELVLAMGDPVWFDELEGCQRRVYIDTDPLFTQVALETGMGRPTWTNSILSKYNVLFTEGMRYGREGCTIPSASLDWIPIQTTISTRLWKTVPVKIDAPITTVMNWGAWDDVIYDGQIYGHKNREFERFKRLPKLTERDICLAAGGPAPKSSLIEGGWKLVDPLSVTGTINEYQKFIAGSWADFGIAKHAYVQSQGGWFSDRSTCYMASGRPVLHQDTGCGDWLPTGEGVILFSDIDDLIRGIEKLEKNYEHHSRMARLLAEDYFEAKTVLTKLVNYL